MLLIMIAGDAVLHPHCGLCADIHARPHKAIKRVYMQPAMMSHIWTHVVLAPPSAAVPSAGRVTPCTVSPFMLTQAMPFHFMLQSQTSTSKSAASCSSPHCASTSYKRLYSVFKRSNRFLRLYPETTVLAGAIRYGKGTGLPMGPLSVYTQTIDTCTVSG